MKHLKKVAYLSKIILFFKKYPIYVWIFFAFVFLMPIQTRLVQFLPQSHIKGSYVFYNTIIFYGTDILIVLIMIAWLVNAMFDRFHGKQVRVGQAGAYLLSFGLLSAISIFVSRETNWYIQAFGLFKLFIAIMLFCFISNIFDVKHVKQFVKIVFWLILAISVFEGLLGTIQYFSQQSAGLRILGEEYIRPYLNGIAKFKMVGGERWVFDRILNVSRETIFVVRPYGTFTHPNVFGAFMGFAAIVSYSLFWLAKKAWQRRVLLLMVVFQIFTVLLSFSRVAIMAWVIATMLWLLFLVKPKRTNGKLIFLGMGEGDWKRIRTLASTVILSCVFSGALFFPQFLERGGVVSYGTTNQESLTERALYQEIAFNMIKSQPLFGVGYQNFVLQMEKYSPQKLKPSEHQPVHNIYLLIASETGLLGFVAFVLFVYFLLKNVWRKKHDLIVATFLSGFFGFLFIGFFDHYPITIQQGRLLFFFIAGFLAFLSQENEGNIVSQETD